MADSRERELLSVEIQRFRTWAKDHAPAKDDDEGGWECDYKGWEEMYQAVGRFLGTDLREWTAADFANLLYIIARDNDGETIVERLSAAQLVALTENAVKTIAGESGAKVQLLWQLTNHPTDKRVEPLLMKFTTDNSEYVRRRALMALAEINAVERVETLVPKIWNENDEYERIACLTALDVIGSQLLEQYVALAKKDGRKYLKDLADRIDTRKLQAKQH